MKTLHCFLIFSALALATVTTARGQSPNTGKTAKDSPVPAKDQGQRVRLDQSTPLKTLESYFKAIAAFDSQTANKCLVLEEPTMSFLSELALYRDVRAGLYDRFKKEDVDEYMMYFSAMVDAMAEIAKEGLKAIKQAKDPVITGDSAVLALSEPLRAFGEDALEMKFQRIAESWKFELPNKDLEKMPKLSSKERAALSVEAQAKMVVKQQACKAFLKKLKAGKYKTLKETENDADLKVTLAPDHQ